MIKDFTELQERVRSSEPLVVNVAQAADRKVLLSVKAAVGQEFMRSVLTRDRKRVEKLYGHIGLKSLEILQADTEKGAVERAIRAVYDGNTQVLIGGLVSTSVHMRGTLNREWELRTGRLLSMVAVYETPGHHKLSFCSDSGISAAPNLEQKKDILRSLLYAVRDVRIQNPKVMALTVNEMVDPRVVFTVDAAGLVEAAKNEEGSPPCIIGGPIAFDVTPDPKSAAHKKIDSRITGDVDLVIFPNMEAGNIMGKSWIYLYHSP